MNWSFKDYKSGSKRPIDNQDAKLCVEPSSNGKWHLRFEGDPIEDAIGSFATPELAERAARDNCSFVKIVMPQTVPVGTPANIEYKNPDTILFNHLTHQ